MTEIEQLYENVGINQVCNTCELRGFKRLCPTKKLCVRVNPLFTAEKQIKLTQKIWELRPNIYPNFDLLVNHSYGEMIATFVNNRWQGLTEQEKQQIKEILE